MGVIIREIPKKNNYPISVLTKGFSFLFLGTEVCIRLAHHLGCLCGLPASAALPLCLSPVSLASAKVVQRPLEDGWETFFSFRDQMSFSSMLT